MSALADVVYFFQRVIADLIEIFNDFLALFGMGGIEVPTAE